MTSHPAFGTAGPSISSMAQAGIDMARRDRIKAVKDAIHELRSGDLSLAEAVELSQLLKAQTSEAEEHAVEKIAKICVGCLKTPSYLIFRFRCGSDFDDVMLILSQFKAENQKMIIQAAEVVYMKAKGLTV